MQRYHYIGPRAVRERALSEPAGVTITTHDQLARWLRSDPEALSEPAGVTFIVSLEGALVLAPRRSEHVGCARGEPVLCAGELAFRLHKGSVEACSLTNQSTGYAPDPSSFEALARALDALGVRRPDGWTHEFIFRRCPACSQLAIVKELVFECCVCGSELPRERNV